MEVLRLPSREWLIGMLERINPWLAVSSLGDLATTQPSS